jgi:hypothetical protein
VKGFILQVQDDGHFTPDVTTIYEIIKVRNWLYSNDTFQIKECYFNDLTKEILEDYVPVGSIEFINKALSFYNILPMIPINIPSALNEEKYLCRKIANAKSQDEVKQLFEKWNVNRLFIKSNSQIKLHDPDVIDNKTDFLVDNNYFVSEEIDLISEWRCFVYRGQLKGIKHYVGDEWHIPKKSFVQECISKINNTLTAYTLDIGITNDKKDVVIEVHNFVSCGLYGFEDLSIIPMLINGYKQELSRKKV